MIYHIYRNLIEISQSKVKNFPSTNDEQLWSILKVKEYNRVANLISSTSNNNCISFMLVISLIVAQRNICFHCTNRANVF